MDRRFRKAEKLYADKQYSEAVSLFEALAKEGHYKAQVALGNCYFYAKGVQHDSDQARDWYLKAKKQEEGFGDAHYMHQDLSGWMGKSPDARFDMVLDFFNNKQFDKALPLMELLSNGGHIEAQYSLGCCFYNGDGVGRDYAKAAEWWLKAADQGYAEAQYNLGCCFYHGRGVEQDHNKAAESWFKAAVQGIADAQDALGDCYHDGEGVEQNYAQAAVWFRMAANQGDAMAQEKYDKLKADGIIVEPEPAAKPEQPRADSGEDPEEQFQKSLDLCNKNRHSDAVPILEALAGEGHAGAQFLVGECFYYGEGVERDKARAGEWWKKAAEGGRKEAKYRLNALAAETEDVLETIIADRRGILKYGKSEGAFIGKHKSPCSIGIIAGTELFQPLIDCPLPPTKYAGTVHYLAEDGDPVNTGQPILQILKK